MEKQSLNNKLRDFFVNAVRQSFWQLGIYDATIVDYVADVLTDFARTDSLYRVRSRAGRRSKVWLKCSPVNQTFLPMKINSYVNEKPENTLVTTRFS